MIHRLAQNSANIVNNFFFSITSKRKNFLLIIHPSKAEIYYARSESLKKGYDFDLLRTVFKSLLIKNMDVLDLTNELRNRAMIEKDFLYYKRDEHYNKAGYFAVGRIIAGYLRKFDHP